MRGTMILCAPEVKLSEGQNVNKIYSQIQPLNVISTLVVVPTTDKAIYFGNTYMIKMHSPINVMGLISDDLLGQPLYIYMICCNDIIFHHIRFVSSVYFLHLSEMIE